MLEYIYFVKCPNCEDEHFYFFNDAKEFAMSLLSQKPIITQVEVDRNDFGECVDSCDLGTVWSWEEAMGNTEAEPAQAVFTKADLKQCDCDGKWGNNCKCGHHHEDPEFATLDNSLDPEISEISDDIRKPVPEGMSIKDLVEAMEANEDTIECAACEELFPKDECFYDEERGWLCGDCEDRVVKCTWCDELYDRSDCRREVDLGWLCDHCQAAIKSRGEPLTFRENDYWDFLDEEATSITEAIDPHDLVELEYPSLTVTLYGEKRAEDDWDEFEHTDSHVFLVPKVEVAVAIWENWITEEDAKDVEGGLEALEDDIAWEKFLETHFDILFEKYNGQILEYFKEEATEDFRERAQEEYNLNQWQESTRFEEGCTKQKSFLEEFDDPEDRKANLTDCPECGAVSYDMKEQYCSNCGLGL